MRPGTIDLRSDTVTRPTEAMREAIATAVVGDDVLGDDPTVHALEERMAEILGKEAAMFVPSGTMSNLVAVRTHCAPGDEFICDLNCHIYCYEQGGYAQIAGAIPRTFEGEWGVMRPEQLTGAVRPDDPHFPRTRLVCLENTHNRGAGRIQPLDVVQAIADWARDHGLAMHLDGARLMNAVVATGVEPHTWASHFDTVSICFSKGLGAPVGSALVGTREFIARARRHRKVLGGGMRQAGVVAAAALFALEHHVERLADDHAHARLLGEAVDRCDGLTLAPADVQTNIVTFDVDPALGTAAELVEGLAERGVAVFDIGPQRVRAVTHLDVSRDDVMLAGEILGEVASVIETA